MNWIKQNKSILAAALAVLVIVFVLCCSLSAMIHNSPARNTPTAIPIVAEAIPIIPTVNAQEIYRVKALNWVKRFNQDNDTVLRVIRKENVSATELASAIEDVHKISIETATTTPPEAYKGFHEHFASSMTLYYTALQAMGNGNIDRANTLLSVALDEYKAANAALGI